jgi:hypothetical protein
MVLASRGSVPNAGGDTKANMITYLQVQFGVELHKRTLRKEVEAVLCQRLQLGDVYVLNLPGNHYLHHHLHHALLHATKTHHQSPPPALPPSL